MINNPREQRNSPDPHQLGTEVLGNLPDLMKLIGNREPLGGDMALALFAKIWANRPNNPKKPRETRKGTKIAQGHTRLRQYRREQVTVVRTPEGRVALRAPDILFAFRFVVESALEDHPQLAEVLSQLDRLEAQTQQHNYLTHRGLILRIAKLLAKHDINLATELEFQINRLQETQQLATELFTQAFSIIPTGEAGEATVEAQLKLFKILLILLLLGILAKSLVACAPLAPQGQQHERQAPPATTMPATAETTAATPQSNIILTPEAGNDRSGYQFYTVVDGTTHAFTLNPEGPEGFSATYLEAGQEITEEVRFVEKAGTGDLIFYLGSAVEGNELIIATFDQSTNRYILEIRYPDSDVVTYNISEANSPIAQTITAKRIPQTSTQETFPESTPTPEPTPTPFAGSTVTAQDGQVVRWNPETNAYQADPSFPEELAGQITEVRVNADGALEAVGAAGEVLATAAGEQAEWEVVEQFAEVTNIARVNELLPQVTEGQYLTVVDESQVPGFIALIISTEHVEGKEISELEIKPNLHEAIQFAIDHINANGMTVASSNTGEFEHFAPLPNGEPLVERIVVVNSDIPWSIPVDRNGTELSVPVKNYDMTEGFTRAPLYDPASKTVIVYDFVPQQYMNLHTKTENKVANRAAMGDFMLDKIANLLLTQQQVWDSLSKGRAVETATFNNNTVAQNYFRIIDTRDRNEEKMALLFTFETDEE